MKKAKFNLILRTRLNFTLFHDSCNLSLIALQSIRLLVIKLLILYVSFFFLFEDSNSLSRKESEKLAESGSSAEESDGEGDEQDSQQVCCYISSLSL